MRRRKSQPKIFIIRDRQGREWTTKESYLFFTGIYAVDLKNIFMNWKGKMKMIFTEIQNGIVLQNLTDKEQDLIIDICKGKVLAENFLSRPCVYDENGNSFENYTLLNWFCAMQRKVIEAFQDQNSVSLYNLSEIVSLCISLLNAQGYDESERNEILNRISKESQRYKRL